MDRKEEQDSVNFPAETSSPILANKSLETAETTKSNHWLTPLRENDPLSDHFSSTSMGQESKWAFRTADSDLESEDDYSQESPPQRVTTPPNPYDAVFLFTNTSPTQSEGTAMTSWDEWDEPSDSLGMDPITLMSDSLGTSLI